MSSRDARSSALLELTWFALVTLTGAGRFLSCTAAQLARWFRTPKADDGRSKKDLPVWCAARFDGDRRGKDRVLAVTALVFDFDGASVSLESVVAALPVAAAGHTSYSHGTKEGHCFRVVVPVDRPISAREHARLWRWFQGVFASLGATVDASTHDPGRPWFVPVARPGYESAVRLAREVLDVDEALTLAPRLVDDERARQWGFEAEPDRAAAIDRARRYLARKGPSIAGAGGHTALLHAAIALVRGFALSEREALGLLRVEFNPRCKPSWTERDLTRKVREAAKAERVGLGYLLEAKRRNA